MFTQLPKRIVVAVGRSSSSSNVGGRGRRRTAAAAATTDRRGFVSGRAVTTNSNHQLFFRSNGMPPHSNSATRRTKVTAFENSSGLKQQQQQQQQKHRIPQPTWSVQDLELTSTHLPISQKELERLARLVLIDVSGNSNNNDDNNLNSLKQDLGNMLHMIQHVTEYDYQLPTGKSVAGSRNDYSDDDLTCSARIYDTVRGVKTIPLRKGIETDPLQERDATQAQEVWEDFLRPKTIRRGGGHVYFAIETTENQNQL